MRQLRSQYAARLREELQRCTAFWYAGWDREHGGMLNCLDQQGRPYATDKGVWMQGRTAWTYARLFRTLDPQPTHLALSCSCLDFEDAFCFDTDGRMLDTVTREGDPVSKAAGSWFSETFYISGCAEYYRATGNRQRLEAARRCYEQVVGMYEGRLSDPYPGATGFQTCRPTRALCTPMILLNVTGVLRAADPERREHYDAVADRMATDVQLFYDWENGVLRETVGCDGRFHDEYSAGRVVNPGHDLECSWFLLDEALLRGQSALADFARTVYDSAMRCGWDGEYGGLMYYRDACGLPMEELDFDMRIWWAHCEGIIAALMMYRTFGDERYRQQFCELVDYSLAHFSDPVHGEWYGMLHRDGTPTLPPFKGHTYKGAFHVMRMLMRVISLLEELPE